MVNFLQLLLDDKKCAKNWKAFGAAPFSVIPKRRKFIFIREKNEFSHPEKHLPDGREIFHSFKISIYMPGLETPRPLRSPFFMNAEFNFHPLPDASVLRGILHLSWICWRKINTPSSYRRLGQHPLRFSPAWIKKGSKFKKFNLLILEKRREK